MPQQHTFVKKFLIYFKRGYKLQYYYYWRFEKKINHSNEELSHSIYKSKRNEI